VCNQKISILLASYKPNPSFLSQQIQSICNQSDCKAFSILIRDDDSQGLTPQLLQELSIKHPNIQLVKDDLGNLGAKGNFAQLFNIAHQQQVDYLLFSDQDDVWVNDKVSQSSKRMEAMESQYGADTPMLIYSDMSVVDQDLQQIAPSFMEYQDIWHKDEGTLHTLLAHNFVTGCTMMFNRALMNIAYPIPPEALLHDWWIALCAAAIGKIAYIDEPLVEYRQHGNNEVGVKHIHNLINPFKNNLYRHWRDGQINLAKSMTQANTLAQRIKAYDPKHPDLPLIESYAVLLTLPPRKRLAELRRLGIRAQSSLRHSLLLARLCGLKKTEENHSYPGQC